MKYGITTVTGHFGQAAFKALSNLVPQSDIIALARNVDKAKQILPAGVDVRPSDYTKPEQLKNAFQGIDKLLFVSSQPGPTMPRDQQHRNVINAAKQAGVSYIAYTSFPRVDQAKSFLSADHKQTEEWIKESGIKHSFLRNNWYLENEVPTIQAAFQTGVFPYSAGNGKVGWTLEENFATAAAKVLTFDEPKEVYEFDGKTISYPELVQEVNQALNKDIKPLLLTDDEYKQELVKNGLDEQTASLVVFIQDAIKAGEIDVSSDDLATVLGHPVEPLSEDIKRLFN